MMRSQISNRFVITYLFLVAVYCMAASSGVAQNSSEGQGPATLTIKSSVDGGPWSNVGAVYPLKGQKVVLKIEAVPGAVTRWYQIFPDLSKRYKNANFPWEKDPYKWIGLAKIDYSRKELTQFRGKWEIEPFEPSNVAPSQGNGGFLSRLVTSLPSLNTISGDSY
jgi:hypothetical protein